MVFEQGSLHKIQHNIRQTDQNFFVKNIPHYTSINVPYPKVNFAYVNLDRDLCAPSHAMVVGMVERCILNKYNVEDTSYCPL